MARKKMHTPVWLGIAMLVFSVTGSLFEMPLVRTWFYQIAWWGYIFLLDGLIMKKTGFSLIMGRTRLFFALAFASAVFWFGWEAVNLRLNNWQYVGAEPLAWLRWPGAFIAFATVLPGVMLTERAISVFTKGKGWKVKPNNWRNWQPWFLGIGICMLVLPMIWPKLFFPLVWGWLVFFLEPFNYKRGAPSLMRDWQNGDLSRVMRLLIAGAIAGIIWESLNYLSGARWEYNIPYLSEPKIFAMPLAGYFGFPPFALECFVFTSWLGGQMGGVSWAEDIEYKRQKKGLFIRWKGPVWACAGLAFGVFMCWMMDLYLIKGYAP